MSHLFSADLSPVAGTDRTARRWLAEWRVLGWPRVERVQRVDAEGRPVGGVQWGVRAEDYAALCSGTVRETAEAA